jgi:hypothetical protein
MARQYKYLGEGQKLEMTDATTLIKSRYIVRGSQLCNDYELTTGSGKGFDGTEDVDWINQRIWGQTIVGRARIGFELTPIIAVELTTLGFNGTESEDGGVTGDWINLES